MAIATVVQGMSGHHDDDMMGGGWWWLWGTLMMIVVLAAIALVFGSSSEACRRGLVVPDRPVTSSASGMRGARSTRTNTKSG